MALAQIGQTPAEESNCAFLLALKQNAQPTALETTETRLQHIQLDSRQQGYNSVFVYGKHRKLSR